MKSKILIASLLLLGTLQAKAGYLIICRSFQAETQTGLQLEYDYVAKVYKISVSNFGNVSSAIYKFSHYNGRDEVSAKSLPGGWPQTKADPLPNFLTVRWFQTKAEPIIDRIDGLQGRVSEETIKGLRCKMVVATEPATNI